MMKIRIHRGARQIGGSITEIYTETTHIFIDFGSELSVDAEKSTDGAMIGMIRRAKCDAVLFTHYHGDHVGLIEHIPAKDIEGKTIRLAMGATARKVLENIHKTLRGSYGISEEQKRYHENYLGILRDKERSLEMTDGKDFTIGDLVITPVMVDHSAYDSYLFVIESMTDHKVIVHTGDFRTHGRLGEDLFEKVKKGIRGRNVDVLITEGTMMSRLTEVVKTEKEMQKEAYELLRLPENRYAFLICSSTNMESLASFANAAWEVKENGDKGRKFFVSSYVLEQLRLYRETAGKNDWDFKFYNANVLEGMDYVNPKLKMTQAEYMETHGFLMLIRPDAGYLRRIQYFKDKGYDPLLIYSMWEGYVNKEKYPDSYQEELGDLYHSWKKTRRVDLHTSGHATAGDIRRMILTVAPGFGILPIHTQDPEAFGTLEIGEFADRIITYEDNEEIELPE
ncbi:MAG: MBL fold metallo-hydrolase [Lachnospiraceae bacterium]|nr:MBL fold metallo-hydrolase [Lachnospiraceae bacterium]